MLCKMPTATKMCILTYTRTRRTCRTIIQWSNRPSSPTHLLFLPLFSSDKWLSQLPLIRAFPAYSSTLNSRLYTCSIKEKEKRERERETVVAELVTYGFLSRKKATTTYTVHSTDTQMYLQSQLRRILH